MLKRQQEKILSNSLAGARIDYLDWKYFNFSKNFAKSIELQNNFSLSENWLALGIFDYLKRKFNQIKGLIAMLFLLEQKLTRLKETIFAW